MRRRASPSSTATPPILPLVDKDGNMVSWIQSIANFFGSGILVDGMGFRLHDRGAHRSISIRAIPTRSARASVRSTPSFRDSWRRAAGTSAFGIMRGMNQAQAQVQFVSQHRRSRDEHPVRARSAALHQAVAGRMRCADRVARAGGVRAANWPGAGISSAWSGDYSGYMGGGQAVMHDSAAKVNYGASSPRKDGAAIPEADPYFD